MKVVTAHMPKSNAARQARFRDRHNNDTFKARESARKRRVRACTIPEFIGVDSEGIGKGKNHRAVLLGVGDVQHIAFNQKTGLHWKEVFGFLYSQYEAHPKAAFVGFFLGYDFNEWLKSLPQHAAHMLLTPQGKVLRKKTQTDRRMHYHPVRCEGWEIDMLGTKRLSIRPRVCDCTEKLVKCTHQQKGWMHICDAGSFFQMSFLAVLDPEKWKEDPDGNVCTDPEYAKVLKGKNRRSYARLDRAMCEYNALENILLARVMTRLARAFVSIGIRLSKDEWYGPGATAAKWLSKNGGMKRVKLEEIVPEWFMDACRRSYFGGWFEIFSHGIIYGSSWNYDINNAYPYATTKLPHICEDCEYRRGKGDVPKGTSNYMLLYCTVHGSNQRIGPVPYRDRDGNILRPAMSKGWYWQHEIDAAKRAGLVKNLYVEEWVQFIPCEHGEPFTLIEELYNLRLKVGKDSSQGMAIKLNNNSIYGKFAQSVGGAPFNNWFYASFITSHCRTQILEAIASHPGGADSVLMVATDGICFDSRHPIMAISKKLGEWAETEYEDLCLFKPGVYWHKEGKERALKVKSRGIPKAEFAEAINVVEFQFATMQSMRMAPGAILSTITIDEEAREFGIEPLAIHGEKGWPYFRVPIKFRMKTCRQALNEGQWDSAGTVLEETEVGQDSDPQSKRRRPRYNDDKKRIDTITHDLPISELETRYYGEVAYPPLADPGYEFEGIATGPIIEIMSIARDKPANYDLPLGENEEWVTVWGGK